MKSIRKSRIMRRQIRSCTCAIEMRSGDSNGVIMEMEMGPSAGHTVRAGEIDPEALRNRLVLKLCVKVNFPGESIREKQRAGNT